MMNKQQLDNELSNIFDKHGAFFAFSNAQYNEKAKENEKYTSLGAGLICPVSAIKNLKNDMDNAINKYEKQDLKENGKQKIIWRELANYECQISYDISDAVHALKSYGITEAEIKKEWPAYLQHCVDNDYF